MLLRRSNPAARAPPPGPLAVNPLHRDPCPGPLSPLERNPQSPKGWKNRESDGVGLAIVAALERSNGKRQVTTPIGIGRGNHRRAEADPRAAKFFCGSPPRDCGGFRPAAFLDRCHLCRKRLHGRDIYMYRGEKAFCSAECRYQQIASDEYHEKCGSEALRSSSSDHHQAASRSPYADQRRLFSAGIAAA